MGIKYSANIFPESGSSEYSFYLYDSAYGGGSTDLGTLYKLEISYKSEGDDQWEPIKASECKVGIKVVDSTMEAYFKNFVNRGEKELYILIRKDSELRWQGMVATDLISLEHSSYPYNLELTAMDGLGMLDGIVFDSSNWGTNIAPGGVPNSVMRGTDLLADIIQKI